MKTICATLLLLAIGFSHATANHGSISNDHVSSKKNAPAPATVRNILSDQLPPRLLSVIRKNYKAYWITSLYKKVINGKSCYCITVENADQKVTLNATPSTTWSITRVVAKDAQES
jgi:hypothetical protein